MKRERLLRLSMLLVTVGVLAGLYAAAEWYVRHREAMRETVPGGAMPGLLYQHARLRHAFVRDNEYYHWIHINRLGFRGEEVRPEKSPGVFRILAVGGSTTFDRGVTSDELTWPSRLEARLNELDRERTFEVINAGVPGYLVLDNFIRLQTELVSLDPDLIILYHTHNDLFAALSSPPPEWSPRPNEVQPRSRLNAWLEAHSLLYAKVRGRVRLLAALGEEREGTSTPFDDRLSRGVKDFRSTLTSFLAVARAHGVPVMLPTVVRLTSSEPAAVEYWAHSIGSASPRRVTTAYEAYADVIEGFAGTQGVSVVDTRSFGITEPQYYEEGDPIHFNNEGAERMAQDLGPVILDRLARGEFENGTR